MTLSPGDQEGNAQVLGLPLKEEAEKGMGRPENISQAKGGYREKFGDANIYIKIAQIHNTAV